MELLPLVSIILLLSGIFVYLNERFLKLPTAIGLMILGIGLSVLLQIAGFFFKEPLTFAIGVVEGVDFSNILLDFMLSYLLFAGALHTDWNKLRLAKGPVVTFATVGVVLSTFITGIATYYLLDIVGMPIPLAQCLLFGALISPTDPIAVLGILKKSNAPESLRMKIVGESLFNDGIALVTFLTILHIAKGGGKDITIEYVTELLLEEVAGGIVLGLVLGYLVYRLLRNFSHYQTEVLLTLALATGGYTLASYLHCSGPLTVVTAGLFLGSKARARENGNSDFTFKFWETIDEVLNALLFVLIGIEILIIPFKPGYVFIGLGAIIITLLARYISLALPSLIAGFHRYFNPHAISIMTWGGLRGGISVAIALTIPDYMNRDILLALTYTVVVFSIIAQGLSLQPVISRLLK